MILIFIWAVVATALMLFYRSKAKEFESLFELSKEYDIPSPEQLQGALNDLYNLRIDFMSKAYPPLPQIKLNKDGSIAKKRGRKPKAQK